jgi:hypothetical protein
MGDDNMIKQTKSMLGIFNAKGLKTVVECPGATTFYSDKIYTHVEADDIETLLLDKPKPTLEKMKECFHDRSDTDLKAMCNSIGISIVDFDKESVQEAK